MVSEYIYIIQLRRPEFISGPIVLLR